MKNYEQRLHDLAKLLVNPERYGDAALQDTVEFEPVFPHGITYTDSDQPELGFKLPDNLVPNNVVPIHGVGIPDRTDGTRPRAV